MWSGRPRPFWVLTGETPVPQEIFGDFFYLEVPYPNCIASSIAIGM
ncbi:MAG: hypothetical protein SAL70_25260 [Scytonema sp. PMC 1070.18]|nr:hypothetical protein [Scytonema sp. PMC 1070.18]